MFTINKMSKRYRSIFKIKILKEAQKANSNKEVYKKYGIGRRLFYKWKKKGIKFYIE